MSLGLVSPLLNRGVRSRWLASLPGAGSKMLTIDSNGDTAFQDIPSASWGSITGTLSSQTDLQNALNAKLSLTGGTMTGALSFSGAAGARLEMSGQQYTPSNVAINMPWGTGSLQGIYGSNGLVGFASASTSYFEVNTSGLRLASNRSIAMGGTIASPEVFIISGGSNVLEQRNSTNAQTFRIYESFTDASNYRRLSISSGAEGGPLGTFRVHTIATQAAGTGTGDQIISFDTAQVRINSSPVTSGVSPKLALIFGGDCTWTISNEMISFSDQTVLNFGFSRYGVGGLIGDNISRAMALDYGPRTSFGRSLHLGNGVCTPSLSNSPCVASSPISGAIRATGGSGTNIAGASLFLTAGQGTGTGAGGAVKIYTAPAGSSGTSLNALVERFGIEGNGLVTLGGTTSSFPAIKRNGAAINFRLADDSADAGITAAAGTFSGNVTVSSNGTVLSSNALDIRGVGYGGTSLSIGPQNETSAYRATFASTMFGAATTFFTLTIADAGHNAVAFRAGRSDSGVNGIHSVLTGAHCTIAPTLGFAEQRNSTNAQTFRVYNTFTDASNYERGKIEWSSNVLRIGTEKAGTGSSRNLELQADGITKAVFRTGTGSLCQVNNGDIAFGTGDAINTTGNYFFIGPANHSLLISNNDVGLVVSKTGTVFVGGFYRNSVRDGLVTGSYAYDTNIAGGSLILQGGASTGNATPSKIIFRATTPIASGTTNQTHSTVFEVTNNTTITISDSVNLILGTTTGTKIGTATTQKIGFYNATPVVQPAAVADATDAASVITQLNLLLSRMRDLGLIAT